MFANYHLIQDAMRFQSGLKKCWRKAGLSQQIVSLLQLPSNRNMTKVYHAQEGTPAAMSLRCADQASQICYAVRASAIEYRALKH